MNERNQDAVAAAIASLELGVPERVTRANAKADGAKTPIPPLVNHPYPLTDYRL